MRSTSSAGLYVQRMRLTFKTGGSCVASTACQVNFVKQNISGTTAPRSTLDPYPVKKEGKKGNARTSQKRQASNLVPELLHPVNKCTHKSARMCNPPKTHFLLSGRTPWSCVAQNTSDHVPLGWTAASASRQSRRSTTAATSCLDVGHEYITQATTFANY